MALIYTEFLRVRDPGTGTSITLNVTSFSEEYEWRGTERRAFAGNMLSTKHTAKRRWTATAEFLAAADVETFIAHVSVGMTPGSGPVPIAPKVMELAGGGVQSFSRRNPFTLPQVTVDIGRKTPFQYVQPYPPNPTTTQELATGWVVDLTIVEV